MMDPAKKAALFNAFLFPGWGQIYLKKYKKGFLIIAGMTAGILSILWSVIQQAYLILKSTRFVKGTPTFGAILQLTWKSLVSLNVGYLVALCVLMLLLWILSIIDAAVSKEKAHSPATTFDQQ